jgi:hypothetical protein
MVSVKTSELSIFGGGVHGRIGEAKQVFGEMRD